MKALNPFRTLLIVCFLSFGHGASAATVSWGALATGGIGSCDGSGNCDVNSAADADGGSNSASASTLLNDARGTSSASSTLSGASLTPTLSVFADSFSGTGIPSNLVQSSASGIQAYTNLDVARTITLDLSLTTGLVEGINPLGNAVVANVAVFKPGAPELTFTGDTLEEIALDPILNSAIGAPSLLKTPLFSVTEAKFEFDVAAGESFLIWALLVAQAEDGGIADASSTLRMNLFEGAVELGTEQLAIASRSVSAIPLPAGLWLFLSGIGIVAGFARRQKTPSAS